MNKSALTTLSSYLQLECEDAGDVFQLCLQMVMHVLEVSEAKALDKLQRRLVLMHSKDTATIDTFLKLDEALEVLDKDDAKQARKDHDKLRGKKK